MTEAEATAQFTEWIEFMKSRPEGQGGITDAEGGAAMAAFIEAMRGTRLTGAAAEKELEEITGVGGLIQAVEDGYITVQEAFSELLEGMNLFQASSEGWRLTNEEETQVTQQFLDAFVGWNPFWGWAPGTGPGTAQPMSYDGSTTGGNQTINVILDGQVLAAATVQNMPRVLDLYGV
jgi:hypothetical protein